jgi:hypothetical protein
LQAWPLLPPESSSVNVGERYAALLEALLCWLCSLAAHTNELHNEGLQVVTASSGLLPKYLLCCFLKHGKNSFPI